MEPSVDSRRGDEAGDGQEDVERAQAGRRAEVLEGRERKRRPSKGRGGRRGRGGQQAPPERRRGPQRASPSHREDVEPGRGRDLGVPLSPPPLAVGSGLVDVEGLVLFCV